MDIHIITADLTDSIQAAFLVDLPSVPEEKTEARTSAVVEDKEIERAIFNADAQIRAAIDRFLDNSEWDNFSYNSDGLTDEIIYTLIGGERRLAGKERILADTIFDILKELSLAEIDKQITEEAATAHAENAASGIKQLVTLCYTKKQPRV